MNRNSIVVNGVTYYKEHPDLEKAKAVLNKYESLVWDIKDHLRTAESLYEDFKEQGLTFNTIEAEGFLRSAKTVMGFLDRVEENMSELCF